MNQEINDLDLIRSGLINGAGQNMISPRPLAQLLRNQSTIAISNYSLDNLVTSSELTPMVKRILAETSSYIMLSPKEEYRRFKDLERTDHEVIHLSSKVSRIKNSLESEAGSLSPKDIETKLQNAMLLTNIEQGLRKKLTRSIALKKSLLEHQISVLREAVGYYGLPRSKAFSFGKKRLYENSILNLDANEDVHIHRMDGGLVKNQTYVNSNEKLVPFYNNAPESISALKIREDGDYYSKLLHELTVTKEKLNNSLQEVNTLLLKNKKLLDKLDGFENGYSSLNNDSRIEKAKKYFAESAKPKRNRKSYRATRRRVEDDLYAIYNPTTNVITLNVHSYTSTKKHKKNGMGQIVERRSIRPRCSKRSTQIKMVLNSHFYKESALQLNTVGMRVAKKYRDYSKRSAITRTPIVPVYSLSNYQYKCSKARKVRKSYTYKSLRKVRCFIEKSLGARKGPKVLDSSEHRLDGEHQKATVLEADLDQIDLTVPIRSFNDKAMLGSPKTSPDSPVPYNHSFSVENISQFGKKNPLSSKKLELRKRTFIRNSLDLQKGDGRGILELKTKDLVRKPDSYQAPSPMTIVLSLGRNVSRDVYNRTDLQNKLVMGPPPSRTLYSARVSKNNMLSMSYSNLDLSNIKTQNELHAYNSLSAGSRLTTENRLPLKELFNNNEINNSEDLTNDDNQDSTDSNVDIQLFKVLPRSRMSIKKVFDQNSNTSDSCLHKISEDPAEPSLRRSMDNPLRKSPTVSKYPSNKSIDMNADGDEYGSQDSFPKVAISRRSKSSANLNENRKYEDVRPESARSRMSKRTLSKKVMETIEKYNSLMEENHKRNVQQALSGNEMSRTSVTYIINQLNSKKSFTANSSNEFFKNRAMNKSYDEYLNNFYEEVGKDLPTMPMFKRKPSGKKTTAQSLATELGIIQRRRGSSVNTEGLFLFNDNKNQNKLEKANMALEENEGKQLFTNIGSTLDIQKHKPLFFESKHSDLSSAKNHVYHPMDIYSRRKTIHLMESFSDKAWAYPGIFPPIKKARHKSLPINMIDANSSQMRINEFRYNTRRGSKKSSNPAYLKKPHGKNIKLTISTQSQPFDIKFGSEASKNYHSAGVSSKFLYNESSPDYLYSLGTPTKIPRSGELSYENMLQQAGAFYFPLETSKSTRRNKETSQKMRSLIDMFDNSSPTSSSCSKSQLLRSPQAFSKYSLLEGEYDNILLNNSFDKLINPVNRIEYHQTVNLNTNSQKSKSTSIVRKSKNFVQTLKHKFSKSQMKKKSVSNIFSKYTTVHSDIKSVTSADMGLTRMSNQNRPTNSDKTFYSSGCHTISSDRLAKLGALGDNRHFGDMLQHQDVKHGSKKDKNSRIRMSSLYRSSSTSKVPKFDGLPSSLHFGDLESVELINRMSEVTASIKNRESTKFGENEEEPNNILKASVSDLSDNESTGAINSKVQNGDFHKDNNENDENEADDEDETESACKIMYYTNVNSPETILTCQPLKVNLENEIKDKLSQPTRLRGGYVNLSKESLELSISDITQTQTQTQTQAQAQRDTEASDGYRELVEDDPTRFTPEAARLIGQIIEANSQNNNSMLKENDKSMRNLDSYQPFYNQFSYNDAECQEDLHKNNNSAHHTETRTSIALEETNIYEQMYSRKNDNDGTSLYNARDGARTTTTSSQTDECASLKSWQILEKTSIASKNRYSSFHKRQGMYELDLNSMEYIFTDYISNSQDMPASKPKLDSINSENSWESYYFNSVYGHQKDMFFGAQNQGHSDDDSAKPEFGATTAATTTVYSKKMSRGSRYSTIHDFRKLLETNSMEGGMSENINAIIGGYSNFGNAGNSEGYGDGSMHDKNRTNDFPHIGENIGYNQTTSYSRNRISRSNAEEAVSLFKEKHHNSVYKDLPTRGLPGSIQRIALENNLKTDIPLYKSKNVSESLATGGSPSKIFSILINTNDTEGSELFKLESPNIDSLLKFDGSYMLHSDAYNMQKSSTDVSSADKTKYEDKEKKTKTKKSSFFKFANVLKRGKK